MAAEFQNNLLNLSGPEAIARLRPHLVRTSIESRMLLEPAQTRIGNIYFVEHGVVSIVTRTGNKTSELCVVGSEGMTGAAVVLGDDRSANESYVQVEGEAWRLDTDEFRKVLVEHPGFDALLRRYVHAFMAQISQTLLANTKCKIEERLARWLLMVHDRTHGRYVEITHDFMATMLGTRRAGVTVALHELEGHGLIRSERGRVTIVDRVDLREVAGEFYGVAEAEYRRTVGLPLDRRISV